ncbi:MAG TPA: hypothetical protein GXX66_01085, partial [Acholeplasmataceae bacterium]|nr:hypothetical protein [Acholeplasmataceae bacterium]
SLNFALVTLGITDLKNKGTLKEENRITYLAVSFSGSFIPVISLKYVILFSSFSVPLFLRSVIPNVTNAKFKEYKDAYIKELVKVFTN